MSEVLFPSDLVALAIEEWRTAVQDSVPQQTLVPGRIPRVPPEGRESAGQASGSSGVTTGASGSPVGPPGGAPQVPSGASSASRGKKRCQKKSDLPSVASAFLSG